MNAGSGAKKRTDALTNRTRLLEVARSVFIEAGLDLEVNEIISRSQLGVGTFYRHFGSREDLLRAIVMQTLEDVRTRMRQAIEPYADDPRAGLQAFVEAQFQVYQEYQALFAAMRDRRLTKLFDSAQREALHVLVFDPPRWVLERGIQAGIFRQDLPLELTVAALIGTFTGIFDLLDGSCSLAELEQQLLPLLWHMLT